MRVLLAAVAVLALATSFVNAKDVDAVAVLTKGGATRFVEMLKISGVDSALRALPGDVTIMAPSNAAIDSWLTYNSMTMADLKTRLPLVNAIVGYNIIKGGMSKMAAGEKKMMDTFNRDWGMTFQMMDSGMMKMTDAGGFSMMAAPAGADTTQIHFINYLPLPGNVFRHFDQLTFDVMTKDGKVYTQDNFQLLAALVAKAGLDNLHMLSATLFAPVDSGFKAAGISAASIAKLTKQQALEVAQYHALDGWRYIPTNFTSGKPVATMLTAGGKPTTVTVTLKTKDNIGSAFVTGGNAKTSEVIAPNLFCGKAIIHAIDGVLLPAAAPAAAATAAAKPAAPVKAGGRKLAQYSDRASTASQIGISNAQAAIQAAVDGRSGGAASATSANAYYASAVAYPITQRFINNNIPA